MLTNQAPEMNSTYSAKTIGQILNQELCQMLFDSYQKQLVQLAKGHLTKPFINHSSNIHLTKMNIRVFMYNLVSFFIHSIVYSIK